ncbi:ribonuclease P protein component [Nitrosomonas sp.]|uniref:ribonuclease P protein component n=1 Tax=Nitrosomonas sp. TaxID=42353 RepID=UPI001D3E1B9F|nr:ribonuclease P protein component [Nitrosomonas sp.]MBX3615823.1 ribonuclease P protein component [Nitrosomonas sp.]
MLRVLLLFKRCKLRRATEFTAVINFKYQVSGNLIQIYAKPNGLGYARRGLIVSKKIERHAVKRNWIKRILRETFRKHQSGGQSLDWVFRLKHAVNRNESIVLISEMQLLMFQLQQCHD